MQHIKRLENKLQSWKEKAKKRGKECSYLRRQMLKMVDQLNTLRTKYKDLQKSYMALQAQSNRTVVNDLGIGKAKGHQYSIFLMCLCLRIRLKSNCSLRGCRAILSELDDYLGLDGEIPCANTIRNWELKMGYFQLEGDHQRPDPLVLILDESMSLGQECILLILGLWLSDYSFDQALGFSDVEVLGLGVKSSWKAEDIKPMLNKLNSRGLSCEYAVSDGGNNLIKCFDDLEITRIEDCMHAIGNLVEKRFKKDPHFEAFSKEAAAFKRKIAMSKSAAYMPPKQRSKGRFLNLTPLAKWGVKIIKLFQQPHFDSNSEIARKLAWIHKYQGLITEMQNASITMNSLFKILKNNGLSDDSARACKEILTEMNPPDWLREGVEKFLQRNLAKLPHLEKKICSSDIIESFFGKFKASVKRNPAAGITESCLSIANYPATFNSTKVKMAMEGVKLKQITQWRDENLKLNIAQKKKQLFKNVA
jgi:hypothetical protein